MMMDMPSGPAARPPAIVETAPALSPWGMEAFPKLLPYQLLLLRDRLEAELREFDGEAALVFVDLGSHDRLAFNEEVDYYPACLIKLPMLAACYDAIYHGRVSPEEVLIMRPEDRVEGSGILLKQAVHTGYSVSELMRLMIRHSDNIAINLLIDRIGLTNINRSFREMGFSNIVLSHKIMYFGNISPLSLGSLGVGNTEGLWINLLTNGYILPGGNITQAFRELRDFRGLKLEDEFLPYRQEIDRLMRSVYPRTGYNSINAYDTALLLERMYEGKVISPSVSERCIRLLKENRLNDRIPAGLPGSVVVAHKTGSTLSTCHDAGIIFTPRGDYALVVLTRNSRRGYIGGRQFIRKIAEITWGYQMRVLLPPYRY